MTGVHRVDWPAPDNVGAFYTTRRGGVSTGPYASLNLGMHVGDAEDNVRHNRTLLPHAQHIQWLQQVHSTDCVSLASVQSDPLQADAATTCIAGPVCAVMTADCLPVLLCDTAGTQVAAVHAGWRGLVSGVIEAALSHFAHPEHVLAWLGPAISQKHFEVGRDVKAALRPLLRDAIVPSKEHQNKFHLDLYAGARRILQRAGVSEIYGGGFCTYAQSEDFFSHRRSTHCAEASSGRMVSAVYLKS